MSSTNQRKFFKESCKLMKRIDRDTNGQISIHVSSSSAKDVTPCLLVTLRPSDGPYQGAVCVFKVQASLGYPATPPQVKCLSTLYHPNISYRSGHVCINVLSEDWQSGLGLDSCLMALLFLLNYPNLEDPLPSSAVPGGETWDTFLRKVTVSLRGGLLGKRKYDRIDS